MPESRMMHLAMDLSFAHTDLRWATTGSWQGYPTYYGPEFYQEIARTASRGKFDLLFFGDAAETPENHGGSLESAVEFGYRWPKHDMSTMIPLMAQAAPGVGFGLTINTTYQHPFHVARLMSSLDWVTGGRMAWNAVTGAYLNEAANWGFDRLPEAAERYRRSREHISVVKGLWNTVEAGAIILDRENRRFGDGSKVHLLNHEGEFYKVRGPLPAMPSPQGSPVIVQAGMSDAGMDLAATHADLQFTVRATLEGTKEYRAKLDDLLISHGRSPRELGCLWVVHVVLGENRKDAMRRRNEMIADLGPEFGLMLLSATFGTDFSLFAQEDTLDQALERVRESRGHVGTFEEIVRVSGGDTKIGDYAMERLIGEPLVVGNAKEVADQLEERHEAGDANGGFMLSPNYRMPHELTEFVDLVIPELQRRGLQKTEYAGLTLRDNLAA